MPGGLSPNQTSGCQFRREQLAVYMRAHKQLQNILEVLMTLHVNCEVETTTAQPNLFKTRYIHRMYVARSRSVECC